MNIHQMQLRFNPTADRVLWQLRTFGGELFSIWLTRRLLRLLWPHLQEHVTRSGIAQLMPHVTVMPEAREMLSQAARERPLPNAQFDQPFNTQVVAQPLGPEPLLPSLFKLGPAPQNAGLTLELKEDPGRSMTLQLSDDLSTALVRLLTQELQRADWGLEAAAPPPAEPAAEKPVTLN